MSDHLQHELKKEFQLERMILFSDAVFAIAITLLALEIKVPAIDRHLATDALLANSLGELIPKFIGFFFSFFIVGLYWTIHHRTFGYVVNYTSKLLRLNLIFLLAVVLMPFSTAFYSEYVLRLLKTPVIVYTTNIAFLGFTNFFLWRYVSNPVHHLVEGVTKEQRFYFSLRSFVVPCIFIVMGLVYLLIAPRLAIWIPPLVPLVMRFIKRHFDKKEQEIKRAAT
jgi:uncharacterized membrane protein